ncbi:MAG: XTP/dITP diphosphatase [Symbiobacteriaceae bacterium]|nr:XTP/dITP diphosphatase [Symbiobacteriaceae bacterium]
MSNSFCLVIATKNQGKVREMVDLLAELPVVVRTAAEMGFTEEIVENGATFAANAILKAETVAQALKCWAVADDSGLTVDYLDGAPGVYSARYAGEGAGDAANNSKLLLNLAGVPPEERTAKFESAIALAYPGLATVCYRGSCSGTILLAPLGHEGFGYDPLFLPDGETLTFGQMSRDAKHLLSHRGKAMEQLRVHLHTLLIERK